MNINVESQVNSMLHAIYLHVIKVLMYEIDRETGEPKIDPDTNQPIPTGRKRELCVKTAKGRVAKIDRAIHTLSTTHKNNNTHTTPSGRVIYYTPIRKPERAYILYTCANNNIEVFAVYTEGKDIQQVLADLISKKHSNTRTFRRSYERHQNNDEYFVSLNKLGDKIHEEHRVSFYAKLEQANLTLNEIFHCIETHKPLLPRQERFLAKYNHRVDEHWNLVKFKKRRTYRD